MVVLSSGILCHVAFVRTNLLEECIVVIIMVIRISELGTTLAVTRNQSTLHAFIASYC
jgi:hypothetical protein